MPRWIPSKPWPTELAERLGLDKGSFEQQGRRISPRPKWLTHPGFYWRAGWSRRKPSGGPIYYRNCRRCIDQGSGRAVETGFCSGTRFSTAWRACAGHIGRGYPTRPTTLDSDRLADMAERLISPSRLTQLPRASQRPGPLMKPSPRVLICPFNHRVRRPATSSAWLRRLRALSSGSGSMPAVPVAQGETYSG